MGEELYSIVVSIAVSILPIVCVLYFFIYFSPFVSSKKERVPIINVVFLLLFYGASFVFFALVEATDGYHLDPPNGMDVEPVKFLLLVSLFVIGALTAAFRTGKFRVTTDVRGIAIAGFLFTVFVVSCKFLS